jgi:uncharacterized membrane protein
VINVLMLGTLVLGGGEWAPIATLLLVVGVGVLLWGYSRVPEGTPGRLGGMYLKMAGLVLLVLCLLDPMWSGEGAKKGANVFVVAVDNSRSMTIRDGGGGEGTSRGEVVKEALSEDGGAWQEKLGEDFRLRRYVFDTRLKRVTGFDELDFKGRASSLGGVIGALGERYTGQPLAGVLLVTDGGATDLADGALGLESLGDVPVYPVVVGAGGVRRDLAIGEVTVSETSFEDSPVTIKGEVRARGYGGEKVIVELLDEKGVTVFREEREVFTDDETLAVRHRMRAEEGGVSFYRLEVSEPSATAGLLPGDIPTPETPEPPTPEENLTPEATPEDSEVAEALEVVPNAVAQTAAENEATAQNNTRVLKVERDRGPYRILYVSGRPNWEYKYLRRATEFDDELDLAGLIRIAEKEPRFEFRGRGGEANNPLFRGYDKNDPDAEESYDESVYVHMNMEEGELSRGFARTELELFEYDAVIFDDVDAAFFTHDQMTLVEKFVSERGGGVLMLGGQESFEAGGFNRTPIGQLLPVYLDSVTAGFDGPSASRGMRLDLTREGWLAPWARLRDTELSERDRLEQMPDFKVVNRARAIKPGASVIATISDGAGATWPGLVVQRFGRGRTGALMVGDLWKWGLGRPNPEEDDMGKAWRQMLRWLVSDVPERVGLEAERDLAAANQPVRLKAWARDESFAPMDGVGVVISVTGVDGEVVQLDAEPSLDEVGLFEALYIPRQTGGYRAEAAVTDSDGDEVGRAEAGWAVNLASEEFGSLEPNVAMLESLAAKTGGRVVAMEELDDFVGGLKYEEAPVTEVWTKPLWHTPLIFMLALCCLIGEWATRRLRGMP